MDMDDLTTEQYQQMHNNDVEPVKENDEEEPVVEIVENTENVENNQQNFNPGKKHVIIARSAETLGRTAQVLAAASLTFVCAYPSDSPMHNIVGAVTAGVSSILLVRGPQYTIKKHSILRREKKDSQVQWDENDEAQYRGAVLAARISAAYLALCAGFYFPVPLAAVIAGAGAGLCKFIKNGIKQKIEDLDEKARKSEASRQNMEEEPYENPYSDGEWHNLEEAEREVLEQGRKRR